MTTMNCSYPASFLFFNHLQLQVFLSLSLHHRHIADNKEQVGRDKASGGEEEEEGK